MYITRTHCFLMNPIAAAVLLLPVSAQAQTSAPLPGAGTILQQVQPSLPTTAQPNRSNLQLQAGPAQSLPSSLSFEVSQIRIVGNTAFSNEALQALVQDGVGKRLTLAELATLATRITTWYQAHGYPLSRAIVPAQEIKDGSVQIQVLEARYGAVQVQNRSSVSDALLGATLARLGAGQAVTEQPLDTSLLLLSDIPGLGVQAILKPGTEVGTSDLDVITTPNPPAWADLTIDNFGSHYIGRTRASAGFTLANPLRHGDLLNLGLSSSGHGMRYGRLSYEAVLNGAGSRVGLSYSQVRYQLGEEIRALDAHGMAGVSNVWARHPLLRTRATNLYAQLDYERKQLRDRVGLIDSRTDRHLGNWQLSLNGDWLYAAGAQSAWNLSWIRGRNQFDDLTAELVDALSARTRGQFSKINASLTHQQPIGAASVLSVNLGAQWANRNLDAAEKMTLGGAYSVRGYDTSALSGDQGWNATLELRKAIGSGWYLNSFVDSAHVKVNRDSWSAGDNSATLSAAGLGLQWQGPDGWRANATLATRIGGRPALAGTQASARGWLSISKAFL